MWSYEKRILRLILCSAFFFSLLPMQNRSVLAHFTAQNALHNFINCNWLLYGLHLHSLQRTLGSSENRNFLLMLTEYKKKRLVYLELVMQFCSMLHPNWFMTLHVYQWIESNLQCIEKQYKVEPFALCKFSSFFSFTFRLRWNCSRMVHYTIHYWREVIKSWAEWI